MALHKRYKDALSMVVMEHPFYASILLSMNHTEAPANSGIKTMATNGREIIVCNEFVEKLSLQHTAGVIIHEVCHVIFQHHLRMAEVNNATGIADQQWSTLWNVATDFAINLQLRDSDNIQLPDPHLYDKEYEGMNAEEIMDDLLRKKVDYPGDALFGVVLPGVGDGGEALDEAGIISAKMDITSQILQAGMIAKQMGKLPGFAEELIRKLITVKADWRELLAQHVASGRSYGYDWRRPSKKHRGVILPSYGSKGIPALNCIIDTSGSVSSHALSRFLTEMNNAIEIYGIEDVVVVQVDACVQSITHETVSAGDITLSVKGRGGTDMNPGFDVLRDMRPAPTILFSDMEIPPLREFPHPTIFCCYGKQPNKQSWGTFVDVTD